MRITKYIFMVDSAYTLLLYLIFFNKNYGQTLFVLSDGIPESTRNKIDNKIYLPSFNSGRFSLLKRILSLLKMRFLFPVRNITSNINQHIVIGQDHLFYSSLFIRGGYILLEDGLGNYRHPKSSLISKLKNIVNGGGVFGYSNKAKSIVLTGLDEIPPMLRSKCTILNLKSEYEKLSHEQRKIIHDTFPADMDVVNFDNYLLTQPFSEDGVLTENEKISLYKKIIAIYDGNIVIKPHPRERTNYNEYFDVPVIDKTFPFQLLLLEKSPKKIVSCFSTVGFGTENIKVDRYGTSLDKKLEKHYGVIPCETN